MVESMVDTIVDISTDDEEDDVDETPKEYCNSECKCYLCETLNNIDKRWSSWEPKNPIEEILKKHIDSMSSG